MDNHKEELEIARRTVSALQRQLEELTARERIAKEQIEACLRREGELLSLLDAKERALRAAIESLPTSANAATPERLRISQDLENFPPTPAQLDPPRHMSHATFSNADLAINVPSGEADGAMVPATGNLETLDSRVESEAAHSLDSPGCRQRGRSLFPVKVVTETSPLPAISERTLSRVLSLVVSKINCEAQTRNEEPEIRGDETEAEQLEVINQPVPSSHERPSKRRRLIKKHEEVEEDEDSIPALPLLQDSPKTPMAYLSSDETPPCTRCSQGTRKRGRRNSVRMAIDDDEDYVPSPPSRKELFKSSLAPYATPAHVMLGEHSEAESPGRAAIVEMEFGGGITVTEIPKEDGKVTPGRSLKRLRRVSGEVPAEVGRSKRLSQTFEHWEEDEIESSDPFPLLDSRVTPKRSLKRLRRNESVESPRPGATQLRRSQRQSQLPPVSPSELLEEDEIESSDEESFIVESSSESSESTKSSESTNSSESSESEAAYEEEDIIGLSGSDSESAPVVRRRSGRIPATQLQQSETSESPESSGQASPEKAVNLLRPSLDSDEEDDDEDDDGSMGDFIDNKGVPDEGSSDDDEPLPGEDDSGSQSNIREELVRRRQHLIWAFEGDLLISIENSEDIALQAICAVYRQQTSDEKQAKDALDRNGRGFDKSTALRGSTYADWLTDGNDDGRLRKSPQDFERRFPGEFGDLKSIGMHHSKQLFDIYTSNEDPYWRKPHDES